MSRSRSVRWLLVLSVTTIAASGGPDSEDALFTDSTESGGPPHGLLDLSSGADLGLTDDGLAEVPLPFSFSWYGTDYTTVTVSNNGTIFFDGAQDSPITDCPGGSGSWSGIAAFADDLGEGTVRTATFGRYPHRVFAVEWAVPHATAGGEGLIQAWLLEGAGRRQESVIVLEDIDFGSAAVDGGAGAVIGIQPGDGSAGLEWACSDSLSDQTSAWFGAIGSRPASTQQSDASLGVAWYGTDVNGHAGQAVSSGEVNGDGLSDILIGQPQDDRAYLIYGSLSSAGGELGSSAGVVLSYGDADSPDLAGTTLVRDIDGDGLDDLILGALNADISATNAGAIYGVAGGTLASEISLPDDADLLLGGPSAVGDARAGSALASADLDGDGYNDLVIGAPYADTTGTQAGAVYLWYGSLSTMHGTIDDLDAALSLHGDQLTDWAGYAVAADDVDGDGLAEIVVGAPNADDGASDAGVVYLVAGAVSVATTRYLGDDSALIVLGDVTGDEAGVAVGLGDLDGDGAGDLFFGAPYNDDGSRDAGRVYAFYGPLSFTSADAADADLLITATTSNARFGSSLGAADLDGDGTEELLVGAPQELGLVSGGGSLRIFDASASGGLLTSDAESKVMGSSYSGQFGEAFAITASSGEDGYMSVAIGAPYVNDPTTGAGATYLWSLQPAFEDDDGDGFVTTTSGGLDCDDGDSSIYPGADEDLSNLIDDDCDGWVDALYSSRVVSDWMDVDIATMLGEDVEGDLFDFEDASAGSSLETFYSSRGLTFIPDTDAYLAASANVWGAAPAGEVGARFTASTSGNALTLSLAEPVDAFSMRLLDIKKDIDLEASLDGAILLSGAMLEAGGEDRTGGVFVGVLFAESVDEIILTPPSGDAWGLDDIRLYWADRTDRDGDGYTEETGDCDDSDADINPGAVEDLSNGIDDDCDGNIDGGDVEIWTSDADWRSEVGITPEVIDFEDLTDGLTIRDDYVELGLDIDGSVKASKDVDGSGPRDTLAAASAADVTLLFEEVQPAVGLWLLDVSGAIDLEGYSGGTLLYTATVSVINEDTDEGTFLGLLFDYGVDELVLSSATGADTWGLDDVTFSELGLDDADGDGLTEAEGDCDDSDAEIGPDAEETWYDGVDSDCDGAGDYDSDGDGHDSLAFGGTDCADTSAEISPDAEETWYDGVDSDCDGASDFDADGDSYDYDPSDPDASADCDDSSATINPGAEETWYDGVDDNCDPTDDDDADGDGYAPGGSGGVAPNGYGDCDDSDGDIGPDAEETWYDGVDSDCDEASDDDADRDGFDSAAHGGDDCDDTREDVYPEASGEIWYDGVDQDCDGASDFDQDGDGYDSDRFGGLDCDDENDGINRTQKTPWETASTPTATVSLSTTTMGTDTTTSATVGRTATMGTPPSTPVPQRSGTTAPIKTVTVAVTTMPTRTATIWTPTAGTTVMTLTRPSTPAKLTTTTMASTTTVMARTTLTRTRMATPLRGTAVTTAMMKTPPSTLGPQRSGTTASTRTVTIEATTTPTKTDLTSTPTAGLTATMMTSTSTPS